MTNNLYYNKQLLSGICKVPRLTQSEYDALVTKPEFWILKDNTGSYKRLNADDVEYDNTDSTLTSTTVQDAIDEVNLIKGGTINGRLFVDEQDGTTSSAGNSSIVIGNALSTGTDKNSRGRVTIYSNNDKAARLWTSNNMETNKDIYLPDATGTLALTSDLTNMAHIEKYMLSGTSISFHVPKTNALIVVVRNIIGIYAKLSTNTIDTIVSSSSISSVTYESTNETCTIVSNNQYTHEVIVIY